MTMRSGFRRAIWILALALATGACGDDTNPIGPANQPEIANLQDNFQFQASNLTGTTQTLTYTWANTGTSANVNQSGTVSSGTATLTIRTPAGAQAYSRSLSETGTFATGTGTAGNWQIDVRLVDVTGTINFRVQKP